MESTSLLSSESPMCTFEQYPNSYIWNFRFLWDWGPTSPTTILCSTGTQTRRREELDAANSPYPHTLITRRLDGGCQTSFILCVHFKRGWLYLFQNFLRLFSISFLIKDDLQLTKWMKGKGLLKFFYIFLYLFLLW